jgi:hypothetical protein
VKFKKIWLKHTGDDRGIVKTGEDQNAVGFTDKSVVFFSKISMAISGQILSETGRFLPKISKWNEKTVKTTV